MRCVYLLAHCMASIITLAPWTMADEPAGDWARMRTIAPRIYDCGRAANAPQIDGKLDDAAWQSAKWSDTFVDIEGDVKPKPKHATRMKMLWDNEHLYIAAQLDEPHVSGTLRDHDSVIFQDNDFELFIDPDGDNHQYYEFELNALNTTWDLYLPRPYKDGGSADNSWEITGVRTAVHIDGTLNDPKDTDRGWSVELAIPWSALAAHAHRPAPPKVGDSWRINFSRVEWQYEVDQGSYRKVAGTKEDNWVWSPQGIIDMHRPERWGVVHFVEQSHDSNTTDPHSAIRSELAARDVLMEIYHRQRVYQKTHGKWAPSLGELAPSGLLALAEAGDQHSAASQLANASVRVTEQGFEAAIELSRPGQPAQRWTVQQDSRLSPATPHPALKAAYERAGENAKELQLALETLPLAQREALEFLIVNMPDRDLRELKSDFLVENVRLAYKSLDEAAWGKTIPKEIFYNNVLPYANINERRDNWRRDFRERFLPLVAEATSASHAAALLNQKLYPMVKVKYSTQRKKADQSPYESLNSGLASCTGLSVLLIDACRAVGVPARFVGTPRWTDNSGNHSWIEVWDDGWHFTGAAEPTGDLLDRAWFIDRASTAKRDEPMNAIYAVSFAKTPTKFPLVWAREADYIYAVNVTDRYTSLAKKPPEGSVRVMFRAVRESDGQRVTAKLRVVDEQGKVLLETLTNNEGFDANDHVGTYLPTGQSVEAIIEFEAQTVKKKFEVTSGNTITFAIP